MAISAGAPTSPQFQPPPPSPRQPRTYPQSHSRARAYSRPVVIHYGPAGGSIPRDLGDGPLAMAGDAGPRPGVDAMKEATPFDPCEACGAMGLWFVALWAATNYHHWARMNRNAPAEVVDAEQRGLMDAWAEFVTEGAARDNPVRD